MRQFVLLGGRNKKKNKKKSLSINTNEMNSIPYWMKYIQNEKIISNLIKSKQMDPNEIYWYSYNYITPMAEAIWNNSSETVEVLLNNGVDVDSICTSIGPFYSALEFAVLCWMYDIVVLLVDRGATITKNITDGVICSNEKVNQYIKRYIRQKNSKKTALYFCTINAKPRMMWPIEVMCNFM